MSGDELAAALRHHRAGALDRAEAAYVRIVRSEPGNVNAWYLLATLHTQRGRTEQAVACYRRVVGLDPRHVAGLNNLGVALASRGDVAEAERCFRASLAVEPENAEVLNNLGHALGRLGQLTEAVASLERAVALKPDYADAYENLGLAFVGAGRLVDAVAALRQGARLKPDDAGIRYRIGSALTVLGLPQEALPWFDEAVRIAPDAPEARLDRALALLMTGDYERGWEEYEWRWKIPGVTRPAFAQPAWDGSDPAGRTVLLYAEQGFGDTLQFVRYAAAVSARGARVVAQVQPRLVRVLRRARGVDVVVGDDEPAPEFDLHAALGSLPRIFGTTVESVPADVPYLTADPSLCAHWRRELGSLDGLRVGIAWGGNPRHPDASKRSIPLERFAPLARVPGVTLVSLQKGAGAEEIHRVAFPVVDLGPRLDTDHGPFMDTAAVMTALDLVVACNSAVSHLAGALGVRVWAALPAVADPRYLMHRDDSPWYPTMRLFRQPLPGAWDPVFERMGAALRSSAERKGIPVHMGPGELIDRITILEIKAERIPEAPAVRAELAALSAARDRFVPVSAELASLTAELTAVNLALWDVLDDVHRCEGEAGTRLAERSRDVLRLNARRVELKRGIDRLLGSPFTEVKRYK